MMAWRIAVLAAISAGLAVAAGCAQSAPIAAPTGTAQPTKAAVAATATSEPTKTMAEEFPAKGKTITLIVPWDAGGGADLVARVMAPAMERDLGIPIQVVNRPGGGTQVGLTELAKSKPDGYTFGMTNLTTTVLTYIDPDRKATYGRKDFAPLANVAMDTTAVGVATDSPFKTMKDLVDAARAKPGQIRMGDSGLMTSPHLDQLLLAKVAGVKFQPVHFSGGTTLNTAVVGGHIEALTMGIGSISPMLKGGQVRLLGVMSEKESPFAPGVPTMEAQGIKVYAGSSRSFSAPGGTPAAIVERLSLAAKRAMDTDEVKRKLNEILVEPAYMSPTEFAAYWDRAEEEVKPLLELAKKESQ